MLEILKSKNNLVPLPEADTEHIKFEPNFPEYVPSGSIGIDLKKIQRLMRLGGISHTIVLGFNDQETSTSVPMITGFNAQGEAFAGKGGVKNEIHPFLDFNTTPFDNIWHPMKWTVSAIALNNDEIRQRILNDPRFDKNVRSSEGWSYYLDQAIRTGIENTTFKHLVLGVKFRDIKKMAITYSIALGLYSGFSLALVGDLDVSTLPLFSVYLGSEIANIWIQITQNFPPEQRARFGHRFSFFPGPQLDRALLTLALSKMSRVAKPI